MSGGIVKVEKPYIPDGSRDGEDVTALGAGQSQQPLWKESPTMAGFLTLIGGVC